MKSTLTGKWKIIWMELWEQDFVDMDVPGHISMTEDGRGNFQFGLVSGAFDTGGNKSAFDSDWSGNDEMDDAFGSIYGNIEEGELIGTISFHQGDESEYRAIRLS